MDSTPRVSCRLTVSTRSQHGLHYDEQATVCFLGTGALVNIPDFDASDFDPGLERRVVLPLDDLADATSMSLEAPPGPAEWASAPVLVFVDVGAPDVDHAGDGHSNGQSNGHGNGRSVHHFDAAEATRLAAVR